MDRLGAVERREARGQVRLRHPHPASMFLPNGAGMDEQQARRIGPCGRARIVITCCSFDAFADATYAEVEAGKLAGDFLLILDHLRKWDEGGVWALAYARRR